MRRGLLSCAAAVALLVPATAPAAANTVASTAGRPLGSVAPAAATGISVTVSGLTGGARPAITITGPSGKRTITRTTTLTGLKPGAYLVAAPTLRVPKGSLVPTPRSQRITVTAGRTAAARIAYAFVGQPVTVAISVNGSAGRVAIVGKAVDAMLTITNRSRSRTLAGFTVVVPPGVPRPTRATIAARGTWKASISTCGRVPACSSLVKVAAIPPVTARALRPGQRAVVHLYFTAPTAGTRAFALIDIGGGYFSVSGSAPVLRTAVGAGVTATPGTPITPTQLPPVPVGASSVEASLPNGAFGPVSLYYEPSACPEGSGACATATLDGTFSQGGTHLYDFERPAGFTITCPESRCPALTGSGVPARARSVAVGQYAACAVLDGGDLGCWGSNTEGLLGADIADTTLATPSPAIVNGVGDAVQVSVGDSHACALRADGTVWCWGSNGQGQLGIDTASYPQNFSTVPVQVPVLTNVVKISAGAQHTCALTVAGTVWCWGSNYGGQSGDTAVAGGQGNGAISAPAQVALADSTALTQVVDIAAGAQNSCALTVAGTTLCWGISVWGVMGTSFGQLPPSQVVTIGDWTGTPYALPITGITRAVDVSVGIDFACATSVDGTVACWGRNSAGQLGIGSVDSTPHPVPAAVNAISTAAQVSAGGSHACARLASGSLRCWGARGGGQAGDGVVDGLSPAPTPVAVLGATDSAQVSAGWAATCAVSPAGAVSCWGTSTEYVLGQPAPLTTAATPQLHPDIDGTGPVSVRQVATGNSYTCLLRSDATVACAGANFAGQLGDPAVTGNSQALVSVVGVTTAVQVVTGENFACALLVDGTARCWGSNAKGQLGTLTAGGSVESSGSTVSGIRSISAGALHACAALVGGQAYCWGDNARGQAPGFAGLEFAVDVVAGGNFTCARVQGADIYCWGDNGAGQAGNPPGPSPRQIAGTADATSLAAGIATSCARRANGQAACWGANGSGQLAGAVALGTAVASPVTITTTSGSPVTGITSISLGTFEDGFDFTQHACARLANGHATCWGSDDDGELGASIAGGPGVTSRDPVDFGEIDVVALALAPAKTCALLVTGATACSGLNYFGDLLASANVGTLNANPIPLRFEFPASVPASPAEEYKAYPIQVSLKVGAAYLPFGTAEPCQVPGVGGTGSIVAASARAAGFCVDVNAIKRLGDGSLVRTVLFVEDPKFTPIRR